MILSSGVSTGIENYCYSKNIPLVGVAPESKVSYLNQNKGYGTIEVAPGHSHLFLLSKATIWGSESKFKVMFGEKLVKGSGFNRGIGVVVGDYEDIEDEILYCIQQD